MNTIKFSVTLFDSCHISQSERDAVESAVSVVIERYGAEVCMHARNDYLSMIEEGVARAENGESLWNMIENEAWCAGLEAIGANSLGEPAHLEFDFWVEKC